MKTIDIEIDEGVIFKIQEGLSFMQQHEIMDIIEEFINIPAMQKLKKKVLNVNEVKKVLKKGKKITSFNFELTKYLLLNIVVDPKITKKLLEDPDDPNQTYYWILGSKLIESALIHIGQLMLLKKTPEL